MADEQADIDKVERRVSDRLVSPDFAAFSVYAPIFLIRIPAQTKAHAITNSAPTALKPAPAGRFINVD